MSDYPMMRHISFVIYEYLSSTGENVHLFPKKYYFPTRACILPKRPSLFRMENLFISSHCFNKPPWQSLATLSFCTNASNESIAVGTKLPVVGDCEGDCCGEPAKGDKGS